MAISQSDIDAFVGELERQPPTWDPDWKITKTLIEVVRIQASQIVKFEENLHILADAANSAIRSMARSVTAVSNTVVATGEPTSEEVGEAIQALKEAVSSAQRRDEIARYAGFVLKFVSKILV